ncbi:MAG: winged helix-turn-helix transcriptional regulator [Nanoarchaeota archaeon]|nr:winged helix-turn-helix transcriptional regulator [Nanoarchaeota archaeon]
MEEKFKLDLKDRKILFELDNNCRQSCSQIGKKVGLSTEVVNYRIKKLEDEKIITQYQLIANLSGLGIIQFKICLTLQHINSEKLNSIIDKLRKNKSVKWIVSTKGNWDLLIALETDRIDKIDELKNEILSLFSGYVRNKALSILVEASIHGRGYLIEGKKNLRKEKVVMGQDRKIKVDDTDMKILKQLAENARKPIIDIAHELKISERIVNYRIKQMVKNKIVLGFKIALNYEKLGLHFYKLFIYLDSPEKNRIADFISYLEVHRNVIHHVRVLGNWDLEPEFETYSEREFNELLKEMKDKFSDIIAGIDIITIDKEHKFVYF